MARINIEDSIHKDIRFDDLSHKLGGKQNALGALCWAWVIAQSYWIQNQHGIPKPVWKQQRIRDELIEVGLAKESGDFIYVCGAKEQFDWLIERKESGRKGGLKTQEKVSSTALAQLKLSQASSSSSSSFSKKKNKTCSLSVSAFDFESLYKKYPRKEGKHRGMLTCKAQVKTQDDFNSLSKAIDSYAKHVKQHATEGRFIKHFSSFMSSWRDWLEPDAGFDIGTRTMKELKLEEVGS